MAGDRDEGRARVGTRERVDTEIDLGLGPRTGGAIAPGAGARPARPADDAPAPQAPPGRLAGAARTMRSFLGFGAGTERALGHFADLAAAPLPADEISDTEARRRAGIDAVPGATRGVDEVPPPTPQTLPAVVSRALLAEGETRIVPEWHMVRHLPGYLKNAIRQLGRQVFAPFTDTPIEEIQVLSTLVNTDREVKAVMTWILRNGIRDDEAELDFGRIMPDYSAKTQIWNVEGCTFMVVKDFAGHYVYAWPGGRGTRLDHDAPAPALRGPR